MPQESPDQGLTAMRAKAISWKEVLRRTPCAVALGNFDGVHLGHRRILEALMRESGEAGLDPVLVTFEPHPRYYFKPEEKPSLLTTPWEKADLLKAWPVEVIPLAFDRDLAGLEAADFVAGFLKERLGGRRFLLGHDHRFGKGARGNAAMLKAHVPDPDKDVLVLEPYQWNGEVVSSSAIRSHLEAARIEAANALLGRPFSYGGRVVRGDGRGRSLGFPTANIEIGYPFKAVAALGVYGGHALVAGRTLPAIANIGYNPTFGGRDLKIEVHLLDASMDLYGQWLEFRLLFHVRPERKFASPEELRVQVEMDLGKTRERLASMEIP